MVIINGPMMVSIDTPVEKPVKCMLSGIMENPAEMIETNGCMGVINGKLRANNRCLIIINQ